MPVETGVTEIADSEEEPLSSSPVAVSDAAADKLSATARYDAQAVASPHQEPAEHPANESPGHTDCLNVDLVKPSPDLSTAPVDHLDVQLSHQQKTDNTSSCTTQADAKADSSLLQASLDATAVGQRGRDVGEHGAANTSSTTAMLHEQTSTLGDTHTKTGDVSDEQHLSSLPKSSFLVPTGTTTEQAHTAREDSQHDAVDNKPSTYEPANNDLAHAVSHGADDLEKDIAADPDGKALAGSLGRDVIQKASGASQSSPGAYSSETHHDTGDGFSLTAHASDITAFDKPAGADLVASRIDLIQDDGTSALSASCNNSISAETVQPPVNSTADSASPSSGEVPTDTNERGQHDISGSPVDLDMQSNTADNHKRQAEHIEEKDTNRANPSISDEPSKSVPADISENPSNGGLVAEPVTKPVLQISAMTVPTPPRDDSKLHKCQSQASTGSEDQTESQSAASQASNPVPTHPSTKLSPQEITLAELRAQKVGLLASLKDLPAIKALMEEKQSYGVSDDDGEPTEADITAAANKLVKDHIKLLHEYNELKDVGQGLMGLIADQRGVRIVEVQDEFGIDAND